MLCAAVAFQQGLRICFGIEEIPDESSYFVTVIAKDTRSEYGSD